MIKPTKTGKCLIIITIKTIIIGYTNFFLTGQPRTKHDVDKHPPVLLGNDDSKFLSISDRNSNLVIEIVN